MAKAAGLAGSDEVRCDSTVGRSGTRRAQGRQAEEAEEVIPDEKKPEAETDPPYLAQLLKDHPGLTKQEALAMIREAGG